jgi:hypothetical protein
MCTSAEIASAERPLSFVDLISWIWPLIQFTYDTYAPGTVTKDILIIVKESHVILVLLVQSVCSLVEGIKVQMTAE